MGVIKHSNYSPNLDTHCIPVSVSLYTHVWDFPCRLLVIHHPSISLSTIPLLVGHRALCSAPDGLLRPA